ncbi:hypothetical protein BDV95DRAFT_585460 [Massariosphaeria phaeospora]|uniref:Zn(2)-C6 fungal-type domain-containing protein n=1 Tax=Massariosphaeria phaeospora TaxID=100035 RepID=A0A7C8HZ91_9PLEO|nr:hypothetical protein BDV95DRAFT_585460 [Massariosphaeria phaeospora]
MSMRLARKREIKACTACARAKVKCESASGEKCKRCQRLGKVCENQAPGAHSHKRSPDSQYNREDVLRLESKIDTVSHFLSSTTHSSHVSRSSLSPFLTPLTVGSEVDTVLPNHHEAVSLLDLYKSEIAPLSPFVALPSHTSPEQLRLEKPILFMAIMMVACQKDAPRQLNLARIVRHEISKAVWTNGERRLALVEAILVYAAWQHVHIDLGSQLLNLLHTAVSLLTELGLNKEPNTTSNTSPGAIGEIDRERATAVVRSLEERRALLGVFCLSSITKICLKDMETIKFTRYADRCCRALAEAKEFPSDIYLVHLARLQQKAARVGEMFYSEELEDVTGMTAPLTMGMSLIEQEITAMGQTLHLDLVEFPLLQISYQTLNLYLYKTALDDRLFPASTASTTILLRTHLLTSCLSSITTLISHFFSLPHQTLFSLPYVIWGQLGHAMLILSRLSDVQHGTWNRSYVAGVMDPKETSRRLARRLEEVMTLGLAEKPARCLPGIFGQLVVRLRELGGVGAETGPGAGVQDGVRFSGFSGQGQCFEEDLMGDILFDFFELGQG